MMQQPNQANKGACNILNDKYCCFLGYACF